MADPKLRKRLILQAFLFIVTILTTTLAGAELIYAKSLFYGENRLDFQDFLGGFTYSFPFLLFLTVHEFGHYITSRLYDIRVTFPYYIPFWFGFIGMPSFGSMGAIIKIEGAIQTRKQFFDIGIAGPLAGFVIALGVLWYGFTHLPPPEHIFEIHPEYQQWGLDYPDHAYGEDAPTFAVGSNLLFNFFATYVATDPSLVPHPQEIIHYPWIFAGFLALLFTSLNLIPIGQLDGGHILYGLIGSEKHRIISASLFVIFIFYAGLGIVTPFDSTEDLLWGIPLYLAFLYYAFYNVHKTVNDRMLLAVSVFAAQFVLAWLFPGITGYSGWLLFAFLIGRVLGVYHPPAMYDDELNLKRKMLGWLTLLIFILSFSPQPFILD
ncbi:site-2 protease family protein [soil metagenome]